jgi:hypothetical protein
MRAEAGRTDVRKADESAGKRVAGIHGSDVPSIVPSKLN